MVETQWLSPETERALAQAAEMWPGVELLMLFGSAAKGRLGPESDVDVYVRLTPGHSAERVHEQRFRESAERACRREIDLVIETPSTSVILRREVASRGRPLFERSPSAAITFRVEAVRAYADLEPQLRKIGAAIRARALRDGALAIERVRTRGASRGR
ncbi:MAG: nucleotidyltransferase domain-containing protein [Polyangiaceae bacterium]|nr:nucleotidyltransferase domain-containing protein [Polyangiaceae bacterium]MCE7894823.1 nucleotidyltransferase domain-containing protein [Sorangiineae bacterium PRO1]